MERTREQMRTTAEEMMERGEHARRMVARGRVSLLGMTIPFSTLVPLVAGMVVALGIVGMYYFAPQTGRQAAANVRDRLSQYGGQIQRMAPTGDEFTRVLNRLFGGR